MLLGQAPAVAIARGSFDLEWCFHLAAYYENLEVKFLRQLS